MVLLAIPGWSSSRIDLDRDWQFCLDLQGKGENAGWPRQPPEGTESVNLPHTWNIGAHDNYLGKAWYFRNFQVPAHPSGGHVELHFGATFYFARVWLNGIQIGQHEGGYTAYSLDIAPYLQATNYLAVEVDNRISERSIPGFAMRQKIPHDAWYDWWDYGGIVRDVWITVAGPVEIRHQQLRTEVTSGAATVKDRVTLSSRFNGARDVTILLAAYDPESHEVARKSHSVRLAPAESRTEFSLVLPEPKLWGIDHPNLYRMSVEIRDPTGDVLDQQSDTFGIRTIEIRDRHLLVNGQAVRLTGLARHEESLWEGLAETPGTMRYDYDDMRSLQVTLTRPVHYPQNPFILDYADRHGILLIPEIPLWQFSEGQLSDPAVIALAKQQMKEMIEQAGNHPSIFAWSVCNESDTATPGGIAYFRSMREFIRKLDPGRYVSYADDNLPKLERAEQSAANDADFLMMNQYFGSWHGPEDELSASLDKVDRLFPNKMAIVSEFGLPGVFAQDEEDADRKRVKIIREQLPELARRDWIAGAILWCYQDYKSRRNLRLGLDEGYVDHGLVDEYRQRKPSYYVWKEMNAPAGLSMHWDSTQDMPASFTATVKPNSPNELPFYLLRDYRLSWEVYDDDKLLLRGERGLGDLNAIRAVTGEVGGKPGSHKLEVRLNLLRPTGEIAAEKVLDWNSGRTSVPSASGQSPAR
jgi:beta-glucuronidase